MTFQLHFGTVHTGGYCMSGNGKLDEVSKGSLLL